MLVTLGPTQDPFQKIVGLRVSRDMCGEASRSYSLCSTTRESNGLFTADSGVSECDIAITSHLVGTVELGTGPNWSTFVADRAPWTDHWVPLYRHRYIAVICQVLLADRGTGRNDSLPPPPPLGRAAGERVVRLGEACVAIQRNILALSFSRAT